MPLFHVPEFDLLLLCRMFGILGFVFYVFGFFLLCSGRIDSRKPAYFLIVLTASACVMISLIVDFNPGAALIQGFYFVMALATVTRHWRGWRFNRALVLTPSARVGSGPADHSARSSR